MFPPLDITTSDIKYYVYIIHIYRYVLYYIVVKSVSSVMFSTFLFIYPWEFIVLWTYLESQVLFGSLFFHTYIWLIIVSEGFTSEFRCRTIIYGKESLLGLYKFCYKNIIWSNFELFKVLHLLYLQEGRPIYETIK